MQEEHLAKQLMERQLYQGMSEKAKGTCQQLGITGLQRSAPCSRQISMHYSFDFAQQVHLPSDPLQPGPIYFLTPRKVGIFGVHCEGVARQVNFLIDEAHCIGKGSNSVISYLHYFFETYGLGETNLHLHCDNCSGQNKNRFVLWYLAWRVATGLHESITLNFLVAGHTKFAPDWCFGLLKQAFRRHAISSLSCLESVVNGSASSNQAQLVGKEDGTAYVHVADWQAHLSPYGSVINGVKKQHHFRYVFLYILQRILTLSYPDSPKPILVECFIRRMLTQTSLLHKYSRSLMRYPNILHVLSSPLDWMPRDSSIYSRQSAPLFRRNSKMFSARSLQNGFQQLPLKPPERGADDFFYLFLYFIINSAFFLLLNCK
jgi:hypothetical protein